MTPDEAFELAAKNVAAFGDTDIFPSPLDRFTCADEIDDVVKALKEIHRTFHQYLASRPPENINALAPLGYTAFRWATQIDPLWNLYYLALVLLVAESIEAKRIPESDRAVFSYRFRPDPNTAHLFGDSTWRDYKKRALEMSHSYPFVLVADVAEFYPRVSHHKLENELLRLGLATEDPKRIKILFSKFSQTRSYGLPVGGPASRILAELALNPVDTCSSSSSPLPRPARRVEGKQALRCPSWISIPPNTRHGLSSHDCPPGTLRSWQAACQQTR